MEVTITTENFESYKKRRMVSHRQAQKCVPT